ncbi:hypothetical protein CC80DRAFT_599794 [Byssothecium circinans]|uniref:Uncharacterized protein n=1 Tax=Byssothecium circinans TaxID=147558 RepID=A0A6A5T963_9PLEO|nr:hypothetical protein CC80DRAFT_599794 [Byssothecium circinans]
MLGIVQMLTLSIGLLLHTTSAAPSISSSNLESLSLASIRNLDLRDLNGPGSTANLEIRGVVGGRKKRYVIARQVSSTNNQKDMCCVNISKADCTNNKPKGYLRRSDCSCQLCPNGQKPNPKRNGCEPDKVACPTGQKQNEATGKCEDDACPPGKKKDPSGKCTDEPKPNDPKKGKCPTGQILDTALGGQTANTNNPSCVPDDSSKCKPGEIPATRAAGDIDPNKPVKCGKAPKESKQCDPRTQYIATELYDNFDGTFEATQSCKRTKRYADAKTEKVKDVQPKKKAKWDTPDAKQQREKRKAAEEQRKKDEEEKIKKGEMDREEQRRRPKKRSRMGYCLPLAAFMEAGMAEIGLKRGVNIDDDADAFNATLMGLWTRDDAIDEGNMNEWSTEFFDEEFVQSDGIVEYWPQDAQWVENIGTIDANEWVKIYVKKMEEHGKREAGELSVSASHQLEERDGLGEIFTAIGSWFARLFIRTGVSTAARFATRVAGASKRMAKILEKEPTRLFKVAQRGKGGSLQGMQNAARKLQGNKYLKNCLEQAKPGI